MTWWAVADEPASDPDAAATPSPPASSASDAESAPEGFELDGWRAPEEERGIENPHAGDPEAIARGKTLYKKACAKCHGRTGTGDGRVAKMLDVTPPAFLGRIEHQSDGELFWKVRQGKEPMPSFKEDFSEAMCWDAVTYVRSMIQEQLAALDAAPAELAKDRAPAAGEMTPDAASDNPDLPQRVPDGHDEGKTEGGW